MKSPRTLQGPPASKRKDKPVLTVGGVAVRRGESADIRLKISETYTGEEVVLPLRVVRGKAPGKVIYITAAVHGDELNGTGIIHDLLYGEPLELVAGTLILAPVVNIFGFEHNERYLPDRRDLNRSFPGTNGGSLASRVAAVIMREIILRADLGVDFHTAAFQRTNFPNVRADLTLPAVRELAEAFGVTLIVNGKGPEGSLRRAACAAGVPTIILEAGEPYKIEPGILALGVRGLRNVLRHYGLLKGHPTPPPYEAKIRKTIWIRAAQGGILRFHVAPGDFIEARQAVATTYGILGEQKDVITTPSEGIVLGMTTMPAVKPGEPICHVALPAQRIARLRRENAAAKTTLQDRLKRDLATSLSVSPPTGESAD